MKEKIYSLMKRAKNNKIESSPRKELKKDEGR